MNNPLIYGKNELTSVVSIEANNDELIIFQEINGEIVQSTSHNKYWILSNEQFDKSWVRMAGELHYKWGKQFTSKDIYQRTMTTLRKHNVDFYTVYDPKESCMVRTGHTYFKGMKPQDVSILSFDIESTGLFHNSDSKVLLISNTFRKSGKIERKLFAYDEYETQEDLIADWCDWVREKDPSILTGHNIYGFDLLYLEHCGGPLKLGRDGSNLKIANRPSKFRVDGSRDQEYKKVRCYGREVLDTLFLSIRYDIATKKYESYGLKAIIKTEGLEKKDRQHYDGAKIRFNYKDPIEWEKIKEYCIHDSDDALAVYDLMCPAFFYLANTVPKSYQSIIESASGSQVNSIMVRSYLQDGHSIPKADDVQSFQGAISRGLPGIYKNCIRWDVAGLYPSIMLQYKVYDSDKDPKGNFLKILEHFTFERFKNKKIAKETGNKYYDDLQSTAKIFCNSAYGFMAAPGLNFNCIQGADFITKTGREILGTAIEWATGNSFEEWDKQFHG